MASDERIPVTEETRKQLHELKDSSETYDDLLRSLARERRRKMLAERFEEMDESREEFVTLDDA